MMGIEAAKRRIIWVWDAKRRTVLRRKAWIAWGVREGLRNGRGGAGACDLGGDFDAKVTRRGRRA